MAVSEKVRKVVLESMKRDLQNLKERGPLGPTAFWYEKRFSANQKQVLAESQARYVEAFETNLKAVFERIGRYKFDGVISHDDR